MWYDSLYNKWASVHLMLVLFGPVNGWIEGQYFTARSSGCVNWQMALEHQLLRLGC